MKLATIDANDISTQIEKLISKEKLIGLIKRNKMSNYQHKDQIMENIETCMKKIIHFNNKFYIETKELPVRSALSPIIVEI